MSYPVLDISRFDDILPYLRGKVFHVTPTASLAVILADGFLLPNVGDRVSLFGNTTTGYFRHKGCVSFFDYRRPDSEEWKEHAHKCLPTLPLTRTQQIAILFLAEKEHQKLISWEGWKREQLWSYRVVPHVECG